MSKKVETEAARLVNLLVMEGVEARRAAELVKMFVERVGLSKATTPGEPAFPELPDIMKFYNDQFQAVVGEYPVFNGAEAAGIIAKLLRQSTAKVIKERLYLFFHFPNVFIKDAGFSWPMFLACWNRLAFAAQQDKPWRPTCQHEPKCGTRWEHERRVSRDASRP